MQNEVKLVPLEAHLTRTGGKADLNAANILGAIFSILGVALTLYLLYRAKKISEEVSAALEKMRTAVQRYDAAAELAKIQVSLEQFKHSVIHDRSINAASIGPLCNSLAALAEHLSNAGDPYLTDLNRVSAGLKDIERQALKNHFDNSIAIDFADIAGRLTQHGEAITRVGAYIRDQAGMEGDRNA